jgi:hypothetical protein
MTYSDVRRRQRAGDQGVFQAAQLASLLSNINAPPPHKGNTGGVIPAVLQAPQAPHDNTERPASALDAIFLACIPNDSAHMDRLAKGKSFFQNQL